MKKEEKNKKDNTPKKKSKKVGFIIGIIFGVGAVATIFFFKKDSKNIDEKSKDKVVSKEIKSESKEDIIAEENIITYRNASFLSSRVAVLISEVRKSEKITTPIVPKEAATKPLPPSKKPKAFPWYSVPPQTRVALIIEPQKRKIVVNPQYPYNICIIKYEGYVAITRPPNEVKNNEIVIRFLGWYLSETTPP